MQVTDLFVSMRWIAKARLVAAIGVTWFAILLVAVCWGAVCQADQKVVPEIKIPDSFESCVASGGQIQGERDGRCKTTTGQVFEQSKSAAQSACKDLCGDGTCQEIVCMAVGCPCPESAASCPVDCKK